MQDPFRVSKNLAAFEVIKSDLKAPTYEDRQPPDRAAICPRSRRIAQRMSRSRRIAQRYAPVGWAFTVQHAAASRSDVCK